MSTYRSINVARESQLRLRFISHRSYKNSLVESDDLSAPLRTE